MTEGGGRSRSVPPPKRGSFGRDPAGAPRRQPLDGASRHAAPDRPGAQSPCSLTWGVSCQRMSDRHRLPRKISSESKA